LELVRLPDPLFKVGGGRFFGCNIWPDVRVFRVQRQPFFKSRLGPGLDRVDWAFRLTDPAIDAFIRVDDEHVLAFVKAVHRADLDTIHGLTANTTFIDDVGQFNIPSADRLGRAGVQLSKHPKIDGAIADGGFGHADLSSAVVERCPFLCVPRR
jgi:hypothetical protein